MTGQSQGSTPNHGDAELEMPDHGVGETDISDGHLLAQAAAGDLDAFNVIVERYQRAVFHASWGILRDQMQAEDATQDTFIRAWNAIESFQGDNARPWLLRIATNRSLDLIRQRTRQATGSLDEQIAEQEPRWSTLSPPEVPEREAEKHELSDRLEKAIATLPEDQRVAIVLADVMGYDYSEIAEVTDAAIGTIKSRISRGRTRLRSILLKDELAREHLSQLIRQEE
jgi:RNA polymerase sigma-70 factor (ECF subfamily)